MSDIQVKLSADGSQLNSGLGKAETAVNSFRAKAEGLSAVGNKLGSTFSNAASTIQGAWFKLAAVGAAVAGVKSVMDEMGRVNDLANRFNVPAEAIQKIGFAGEQSGADLELIIKGLQKAELAAIQAAKGNEGFQEAFAALGLSVEAFLGMSIEERLAAIADGFADASNQAAATEAVVVLLGKSGREMQQMLAEGGDAIRDAYDQAATVSNNSVAKIDEVGDRIGAVFMQIKAWGAEALGFIFEWFDRLSVAAGLVITYISKLPEGFKAAKQAADDYVDSYHQIEFEKEVSKKKRSENRGEANARELAAETQNEATAKAAASTSEKKKTGFTRFRENMELRAINSQRQARENEEQQKQRDKEATEEKKRLEKAASDARKKAVEQASEKLDSAGSKLDDLKSRDSNNVPVDSLRRIGGGLANVNYSGVAKDEMRLAKQVDLAQRQYDELKKILEALKSSSGSSIDGITD